MTTDETQSGTLENWSPQQLKAAFDAGDVAIIDVRTPQEYAFEHIHGALLAPLATFEPRHLPAQDGKRLVFHCGSGVRSRKVAEACLAAGMRPVA
ncbi:MAG: rhodanese-like domain-containing protein, partial [Pseudomonadota bacterium]